MAKKLVSWKVKSITLESFNVSGERLCTDAYAFSKGLELICSDIQDVNKKTRKYVTKLILNSCGHSKIITVRSNKEKIVFARVHA